ncbi:hypothetical protein HUG10_21470 (plasmid) [Halorarum halophilum]|uniref:Uncharacterized protein n=1 Tax=Halorarum halophilum TaxID=2743090 RepID=A0A7D5KWC1_9EURY|nr:hypothetical protein [Halobaculum halophilum]QLG30160.1 hypothetical protein HUG10_21470 [Halobaculum halophilum]
MSDDDAEVEFDDSLDPGNRTVYFERSQDDEKEYPDTYRKASVTELASGREVLRVGLTARQLQGWADTLGAKLSDDRRRVGEDLATVDEVYVLYLTRDGAHVESKGVAFTFNAAKKAQARLRDDLEMPWSEEIEIETIPFFTD